MLVANVPGMTESVMHSPLNYFSRRVPSTGLGFWPLPHRALVPVSKLSPALTWDFAWAGTSSGWPLASGWVLPLLGLIVACVGRRLIGLLIMAFHAASVQIVTDDMLGRMMPF